MKYQFHESSSSGSQVVPCGQTDMTNLIVAFRNFENAYKQQKQRTLHVPKQNRVTGTFHLGCALCDICGIMYEACVVSLLQKQYPRRWPLS